MTRLRKPKPTNWRSSRKRRKSRKRKEMMMMMMMMFADVTVTSEITAQDSDILPMLHDTYKEHSS
jgi:hypothetical protein